MIGTQWLRGVMLHAQSVRAKEWVGTVIRAGRVVACTIPYTSRETAIRAAYVLSQKVVRS